MSYLPLARLSVTLYAPFQRAEDKTGVAGQGCEPAIVSGHDAEALHERAAVILHRHATVKIVGHDDIGIDHRKAEGMPLLHHADAPVIVGGEAIAEIVEILTGNVGAGKECLMAHQHAVLERLPRELTRRTQMALAQEAALIVHNVGVTIDDRG